MEKRRLKKIKIWTTDISGNLVRNENEDFSQCGRQCQQSVGKKWSVGMQYGCMKMKFLKSFSIFGFG